MLLCGCPDDFDPTSADKAASPLSSSCPPMISLFTHDQMFSLDDQQQTSQLDRFTYFLLVKCNSIKANLSASSKASTSNDLLDILLNTLLREMSNSAHRDMARYVTARFVRSVIRLFIILSLQSSPEKSTSAQPTTSMVKRLASTSHLSSSSSNIVHGPQSILVQCKRIFQALIPISIEALVHMADLLMAPVRHGIARPMPMFNLLSTHTDILQSLDEVFNVDSEYYRAYHENLHPSSTTTTSEEVNEAETTTMNNINNNNNSTMIDVPDEDENNSDTQSQHETMANTNLAEQTAARESADGLSDNESEMELELLAESDTDNESNRSAPNTNTHRTSATAGSENMALFSDDEDSDSDGADSVRSDSVLGDGDENSQTEPMIFDDARDALAAAAAAAAAAVVAPSSAPATAVASGSTDRLTSMSMTNPPASGMTSQASNPTAAHLNVPRLTGRVAITGELPRETHDEMSRVSPFVRCRFSLRRQPFSTADRSDCHESAQSDSPVCLASVFSISKQCLTIDREPFGEHNEFLVSPSLRHSPSTNH